MKLGRILILGCVAAAIVTVSSCAEPPQDRIRKARQALSDLRDVTHADQWAPADYEAAAAAVAAAERELAAQERRYSWMRDYTKASDLFAQAAVDVELARGAAEAGKVKVEREAREALDALTSALTHARATLMIAPVGRDGTYAASLDADLERAEERIEEIRNLIVAEKFQEAVDRAEEILDRVSSLLRSVSRTGRR